MTASDNPLSELFALEALALKALGTREWDWYGNTHERIWGPGDTYQVFSGRVGPLSFESQTFDHGKHEIAAVEHIVATQPARLLRIIAAVREALAEAETQVEYERERNANNTAMWSERLSEAESVCVRYATGHPAADEHADEDGWCISCGWSWPCYDAQIRAVAARSSEGAGE